MHSFRIVLCIAALLTPVLPTAAAAQRAAPGDTADKAGLPLTPARTFQGTFREGTWISLDVSPDGRTLVFDLLGDLYTLPITGGTATPLMTGMAFYGQPRFSPDGSRVLYVSDVSGGLNLYAVALDGSDTVQITKGSTSRYQSPAWTPDGTYVVASKSGIRSGTDKLWLYHVEGGSGVPLIDEPERLRTVGAEVSPDGRYIWFAQRQGSWDYNAQFPQYQLAVYDRESGERYVRTSRYGSAFRPTLSPDGRWLVYGTRHDSETGLRIRDLTTGDERWLAYPVQRDEQESRATLDVLPGMSFTPDSRELVVSYGGRIWRVPVGGGDPIEVPFTAEVSIPMGPEVQFDYRIEDTPTFVLKQIRGAVPSPDGGRLAFTAANRLWVMEYPGGTPRRLTEAEVGAYDPAWSPDGRWLAYGGWTEDGGGHLYRIRANGSGGPHRLTELAGVYRQPVWSPDGERIVAIRGSARAFRESTGPRVGGDPGEFVWVPAGGGPARLIAPTGDRTHPHFSASGDRIYATDDSLGLVSMRWDGTDVREHLKVVGATLPGEDDPQDASLILISPDRNRAIAQVLNHFYLINVPLVGGDAPRISVAKPEDAAVPVRKLTDVGGDFPAWARDGERIHWSIGNAHVVYGIAAADSVQRAMEDLHGVPVDTAAGDPAYVPEEHRVVIRADRDIPRWTAVLRGGRAITMRGEEVIENADVVIRDNRIVAVGAQGSIAVPEGAEVVDVSGMTVMPGFVDVHAHLRPAWGVHKPTVWQYLANLAYGVTTTRDPQTGTTDVLTYSDRVEMGDILGPRVFSTGPGVFWSEQVGSLDHARDVLRRYSEYWDTRTIKQYVAGNRQQRQWIVAAARELGLMPTTEGSLDVRLNLTQAVDGYSGQEHNTPVYPLYDDWVRLFAFSGTTYTPTLLVTYGGPWVENYFYATENPFHDPKLRRFTPYEDLAARTLRRPGWFHPEVYAFRQHARFVADLVEAGGSVGVGSHGQLQGLGYHWELWTMHSGGLSNHDALRAATLMGAEAIGYEHDLGSIEPGKLADLVVLRENPLENIRNTVTLRYVVKNGRLYDAETLDEIAPQPREAGPFPWAEPEPGAAIRR